ncbi:MAG: sialate O-acetylesterase [Bacteroidales bacterium]|nr:sialate O-acetylesterase [Bacteroidales bacterium]
MNIKHLIAIPLALSLFSAAQAKVTLPSVIGDNMVLQQKTEAALWGKASPGRKVTVTTSWDGNKVSVQADPRTGSWLLKVPTPEAGGPYEITISDGDKVTLRNVLVGEVWFASGQSNMEMPVKGYPSQPALGGTEAITNAKPSRQIRICNVIKRSSLSVQEDPQGAWELNSPDVVANTSATAYFFADVLQEAIDVPVGIIVASWGGSTIQAWMEHDLLKEKFPEVDLGSVEGSHPVRNEYTDACLLYNGMVAPLAPYTIKGMIWYQGEANREHPDQYVRLQTEYVRMMRGLFQVPDAAFYYVQIAPWPYHDPDSFVSGYFYEGQQKCLETIPHSGMAVTCDIGEWGPIHPSHKREVGQRLAWLAMQHDYGFDSICADAPTYESVEFKDGKAYVTFKVDDLMLAFLEKPFEGFEIAGEDRVFHKAEAKIDWDYYKRVIVQSPEVPEPVAVRYCFRNWCKGSLYNNYGIPAAPFRTDDW